MNEFERLRLEFGWYIEDHLHFTNGIWSSGASSTVSYPSEMRTDLARIEEQSFWFRHRNREIQKLLNRHGQTRALWEIGSGNGFVAAGLQAAGLEVVAVEPAIEGAQNAYRRGVKSNIATTLENLGLPDACIPALGLFDVLEHLEFPEPFLRECFRVLQPGGIVALTVPAHPVLWSQADSDAGHFRRYARRTLDLDLASTGFTHLQSYYMMLSLWLPLFVLRTLPYRLGRRRTKDENLRVALVQLAPRPGLASALITAALSLESGINRWVPLPFGTSVVGLYCKPAKG